MRRGGVHDRCVFETREFGHLQLISMRPDAHRRGSYLSSFCALPQAPLSACPCRRVDRLAQLARPLRYCSRETRSSQSAGPKTAAYSVREFLKVVWHWRLRIVVFSCQMAVLSLESGRKRTQNRRCSLCEHYVDVSLLLYFLHVEMM